MLAAGAQLKRRLFSGTLSPLEPERTFLAEGSCLSPRILEAEVTADRDTNTPMLNLTFDAPGASDFGALTGKLVRRRLLVVLDGRVTSAPVVMEAITGGRAMITFGRDAKEADAERLAKALRGGALPGPMTLETQGRYGPPSLLK